MIARRPSYSTWATFGISLGRRDKSEADDVGIVQNIHIRQVECIGGVLGNKTIYTDVKDPWKELHPGMRAKGGDAAARFWNRIAGATS